MAAKNNLRVQLREEKIMSAKVSSRQPKVRFANSFSLMSAETCSKSILTLCSGHGKSPCFSDVTFLTVVDPDYPLSILSHIDGEDFLECAF
jgi:hypothetical protein